MTGVAWSCPSCNASAMTYNSQTPMHRCDGLVGLMTPLVPVGMAAKHERVERGDYIGSEVVQVDGEGRPVMAVVTTRDDGQDCTVYAPVASAGIEGP
jgi:hypothetical protein